jgi:hypothetical protein
MKRKAQAAVLEPSVAEVQASLPKSETIHLRVSKAEKAAIRATAGALHLSITETC